MDVNSLIQSLKDPAIVQSMPLGDKLLAGLYVTLMGMTITFVGLLFLWAAIALMSRLIGTKKPSEVKVVERAVAPNAQEAARPTAQVLPANENAVDDALIAVITAAVAASLKTSIHNIVVRNIVRVHDDTPAWARAGRTDQISKRF